MRNPSKKASTIVVSLLDIHLLYIYTYYFEAVLQWGKNTVKKGEKNWHHPRSHL